MVAPVEGAPPPPQVIHDDQPEVDAAELHRQLRVARCARRTLVVSLAGPAVLFGSGIYLITKTTLTIVGKVFVPLGIGVALFDIYIYRKMTRDIRQMEGQIIELQPPPREPEEGEEGAAV